MIRKIKTGSHEEWLALRAQYIGGSDAGAVVGMNPYRSAFALWMEKTGQAPGFEGNLATEVGTYLEEFVAQKWAEVTGRKVRNCNQSFVNDDYPWAIANIDRDIVGSPDEGLEIKTTSELNMKKFKDVEFPEQYYCQCVHYLAVTGRKRWHLAVLIGNREFKTFTLERDEGEIAALMDAEKAFWEKVQSRQPPEVDGSESSKKALMERFPEGDGSAVRLDSQERELREYLELKAQAKQLDTLADKLANGIKLYMGDADAGCSTGFKVSWKNQTRRTFDTKRFQAAYPQIPLDGFYNVSNSRVFKVMEVK